MADEEQTIPAPSMPQARYTTLDDDYQYEIKPLPRPDILEEGQAAQSGGMASQFETVASGLDSGV
jgi:hypothetical protein